MYTTYDFDNLDRLEELVNVKTGGLISSYASDYADSNLIDRITFENNDYYEYSYDNVYRMTDEYLTSQHTFTLIYP